MVALPGMYVKHYLFLPVLMAKPLILWGMYLPAGFRFPIEIGKF